MNERKFSFNKDVKKKSMYCLVGGKIKRQSGIVRNSNFYADDRIYQIGSNAFPKGTQATIALARKKEVLSQIECIGEATISFPSATLPRKVRAKILDMMSNAYLAKRSRTKEVPKPRIKINLADMAQRSLIRAKFALYV
jgi:hypothetical protein